MANPRKFSEKIALHNQKQAEETAAFEAILREVSATTRQVIPPKQPQQPPQQQHLQLNQNLGAYRGGSLPNVNQIAHTSGAIDLQGALNSLEGMKQAPGRQSLVDRMHRDRNRAVPGHGRRSAPFDKRADHSPYGSAYLSPPPDSSWRRTNSDSALHTSAMAPQMHSLPDRRVDVPHQHTVDGDAQFLDSGQFWDKKDVNRPKSCEVPGINIYPSPEQDPAMQGMHSIPISCNTGSLPDLTNLHFPSGLATPLDSEELQGYTQVSNPGNLSPTSAHHIATGNSQSSPSVRRRHPQGGPTPLVLQGQANPSQLSHQMVQQKPAPLYFGDDIMQTNHMEGNPGNQLSMDSSSYQMYNSQQHSQVHSPHHHSPLHSPHHSPQRTSPLQQHSHHPNSHIPPTNVNVPTIYVQVPDEPDMQFLQVPNQRSPVPRHITNGKQPPPNLANHGPGPGQLTLTPPRVPSPGTDSSGSSTDQQQQGEIIAQYRNSTDCPQSPTSPLSQHSYSPSQSPGLPPTSKSNSPFSDAYYVHQTNALQHQFEQFSMIPDMTGSVPISMATVYTMVGTAPLNNTTFSQAAMKGPTTNQEFASASSPVTNNHYYSSSPQQPSSPQAPSPQGPSSPTVQAQGSPQQHIPPSPTGHVCHQDPNFGSLQCMINNCNSQQCVNNIPDIIFTGVDEGGRQDLVKDISNAMAGMMDSFDSELFPTDEVLKVGLDPLDLDGLQMLTDPNMVTDPATEDSFRLDHL